MSEEELPVRFADTAQAAMDASKTAGQLMFEAREAQGLHIATLAVALKVPVKKLEALEEDRFEELPDAVFVRALASSVCRALKMDPAPVLAKLPQLNTSVLNQAEKGMNVSFRTRSDGPAPSALSSLNRPVVLGVLALLLAAIVLILFPDFASRSASINSPAPTSTQISNTGVSMGSPANVPSVPVEKANEAATNVVSASSTTNPVTTPTLAVTPSLSTPSVSSPTLTVTPVAVNAIVVPADSVVVFAATGESWVEVKDARGQIILQRTLQNGDKTGAGPALGKLPFSVIVGRSHLTQVSVRGQSFDLAPVSSKDAVARFQVK